MQSSYMLAIWLQASDDVKLLCVSVDVQHGLRRTLHRPAHGPIFNLHWRHLQRLLLQIPQHVWLWMERSAHVRPQRSQLVVSQLLM